MNSYTTIKKLLRLLFIEVMLIAALLVAYLLPPNVRGPVYLFEIYFVAVLAVTKEKWYFNNIRDPVIQKVF